MANFLGGSNHNRGSPASPQGRDSNNSTQVVHEDNPADTECWSDGNVETPITIQQYRVTAIQGDTLKQKRNSWHGFLLFLLAWL